MGISAFTSHSEAMTFDYFDGDNFRAYYQGAESNRRYCVQFEGHKRDGSKDFRLYVCSRDGEPSHQINQHNLGDLANLYCDFPK